jgi:EAL domain-containing protein (putative c-di-GMP-specific phosphodiesterase class I)
MIHDEGAHHRSSQQRSLNRDINTSMASQRQISYPTMSQSITGEYLQRLTTENQQLKLQIAEKRLIQSEELNAKLLMENEELRRRLTEA